MIWSLGQGIRLPHRPSGAVVESEVEVDEVQGPTSLTTVEFLGHYKVLEILVVYSNFHWIGCSFKEMSQLF